MYRQEKGYVWLGEDGTEGEDPRGERGEPSTTARSKSDVLDEGTGDNDDNEESTGLVDSTMVPVQETDGNNHALEATTRSGSSEMPIKTSGNTGEEVKEDITTVVGVSVSGAEDLDATTVAVKARELSTEQRTELMMTTTPSPVARVQTEDGPHKTTHPAVTGTTESRGAYGSASWITEHGTITTEGDLDGSDTSTESAGDKTIKWSGTARQEMTTTSSSILTSRMATTSTDSTTAWDNSQNGTHFGSSMTSSPATRRSQEKERADLSENPAQETTTPHHDLVEHPRATTSGFHIPEGLPLREKIARCRSLPRLCGGGGEDGCAGARRDCGHLIIRCRILQASCRRGLAMAQFAGEAVLCGDVRHQCNGHRDSTPPPPPSPPPPPPPVQEWSLFGSIYYAAKSFAERAFHAVRNAIIRFFYGGS